MRNSEVYRGSNISKQHFSKLMAKYFLKNHLYNIMEDNILLDQNDLEQLGMQ